VGINDACLLAGYYWHGCLRDLRRSAGGKITHGPIRRAGVRRGDGGGRRNHPRHGAGEWPGILGQRSHRSGGGDGHQHADHLLVRQPRRLPKWILPVLDAVGLAVFVGIGVNKAFLAGSGPLVAVCMGVVTGVGGGIIRDVLAREIPMILRTEIYATACIVGGIVHATAHDTFHLPLENSAMMGMVVTLVIRLAAIRWHLKLPTFALDDNGR